VELAACLYLLASGEEEIEGNEDEEHIRISLECKTSLLPTSIFPMTPVLVGMILMFLRLSEGIDSAQNNIYIRT